MISRLERKAKWTRNRPLKEELSNRVFGKLKVERLHSKDKYGSSLWTCTCACGKTCIVKRSALIRLKYPKQCCGCSTITTKRRNYHKEMSGSTINSIVRGAERRNYEFNITINYIWDLFIKQNRKCALSGLDIGFGSRSTSTTASLDRIDNNIGYVVGNVQWVHKDINWMKQDYSQAEFVYLCKKVAENV